MPPRLRRLFASIAVLVALAASTSVALADGPHPTGLGTGCEGLAIEGSTMSQSCEVIVVDFSSEPTPPTGTVTIDGSIVCTLIPLQAGSSSCGFPLTTPAEGDVHLTAEYPGDATHAPASLGMEWFVDADSIGRKIHSFPVAPFSPPHYDVEGIPAESKPGSPATEAAPSSPTRKSTRPRITARPRKRTRGHLARFRFAGDESFECKLDRGPYRPCGDTFKHRVSVGAHVLRVRPAGGGPAASARWRVLPSR